MANPAPKGPKSRMRSPMIYLGLGLAAVLLFSLTGPSAPPSKQVPYSELKQKIRDKAFAEVVLTDKAVTGIPPRKEKPAQKGAQEDKGFSALFVAPDAMSSLRPAQDESLIKLLDETGTKYEVKVENTVFRDFILQWILPIAAMIFLWGLLMKRMGPGTEVMSCGRRRRS
jgi:cell division protease FtsH